MPVGLRGMAARPWQILGKRLSSSVKPTDLSQLLTQFPWAR